MVLIKWFCVLIVLVSSNAALSDISNSEFTGRQTDGFVLPAENEKAIVYFWATWCGDCKNSMTGPLNEQSQKRKSSIIAVNTDAAWDRVENFLDKNRIGLSVIVPDKEEFIRSQKILAIPTWVLVKRNGEKLIELERGTGKIPSQNLENL